MKGICMNFLNSDNIVSKNIHWLLRIVLAITFVNHGYPKLGKEVASLGMIGYLVGPFEFLGGLFVLIGPFIKYKNSIVTRLGGFMIAVIMLGAIYMHAFSWKDKGFLELEWQMLLFATSLMFVFKGDEI